MLCTKKVYEKRSRNQCFILLWFFGAPGAPPPYARVFAGFGLHAFRGLGPWNKRIFRTIPSYIRWPKNTHKTLTKTKIKKNSNTVHSYWSPNIRQHAISLTNMCIHLFYTSTKFIHAGGSVRFDLQLELNHSHTTDEIVRLYSFELSRWNHCLKRFVRFRVLDRIVNLSAISFVVNVWVSM